ncbi:MAG: hypothetical protein JNN15_18140, partial [Blastocatellia bacterium]|nr:hypothetical protein [Blastocatellia bacterium]
KISGRDLAIVIGAIVLSALLFLITSRRGPIPADVTLLSPADSASLLSSRVELSWSCTAPNFKLLIEEGSSIVLEKSLKEQNYILSEEELQLLKPGNTYTWRVIPYDTMGKELPHEERLAHFNLISPPPPPAPIKAPSYANSPTITIRRGTTGAD